MNDILYALWLFVPAGTANVVPVLISKLPILGRWNYPLDCNKTFHGKRIFGEHKTWRGVIMGTICALGIFLLQQKLSGHLGSFSNYLELVGYDKFPAILGILLGLGALLGDAIASFFKRQRGILPGESWIPFDQLDYVIGSTLLATPVIFLSFYLYFWVFVAWFIMHLVFSYAGFRLGLKRTPI